MIRALHRLLAALFLGVLLGTPIRGVSAPVSPPLKSIDIGGGVLVRLLPGSQRVVFADSGHQMWLQHPREAREEAEAFFALHGGPPP